MNHDNFKKIMIFGRPGSGKSTFALWLSGVLNLPLHHLDKHFFIENWVKRDYGEFLDIQRAIINTYSWIIDGNSVRSLAMRFEPADLVLYFNYPISICYFRVLKRIFLTGRNIDDRAPGCKEVIRWPLLKYMWNFEKRVEQPILDFKAQYPNKAFREIRSDKDLEQLKRELVN